MKIGVIVGRFQCYKLTDGHKELIRHVMSRCDKLIIFVGVYPKEPNFKNALPFEMRKQMIEDFIPLYLNLTVVPIVDVFDIPLWSKNLDKMIKELTSENDSVTLYGSRDSFIFNYIGKYSTVNVPSYGNVSASQLREEVKNMNIVGVGEEFRKAVIWSLRNKT